MSFIALRDAAALPPGRAARRLFVERFAQLAEAAAALRSGRRCARGSRPPARWRRSRRSAARGLELPAPSAAPPAAALAARLGADARSDRAAAAAAPSRAAGIETVRGEKLELTSRRKRCIHSRFCVTWAPQVFLANVQGPVDPPGRHAGRAPGRGRARLSVGRDPLPASRRRAGRVRAAGESRRVCARPGPTLFAPQLLIDGAPAGFRATLCRCGASKNKPYCDGSHHELGFSASGEPPGGKTDMLPVRDGAAGDRSADRRAAAGARQSGDHERHRPGRGARDVGLSVPLRRQRQQAVLRRHARQDRLPLR